jgi:hypothetical protein
MTKSQMDELDFDNVELLTDTSLQNRSVSDDRTNIGDVTE